MKIFLQDSERGGERERERDRENKEGRRKMCTLIGRVQIDNVASRQAIKHDWLDPQVRINYVHSQICLVVLP